MAKEKPEIAKPVNHRVKPRQFTLSDQDMELVDQLANKMTTDIGVIKTTRTDVIRVAIRELAKRRLKPKSVKKTKKGS